jgi:hypothetical protein
MNREESDIEGKARTILEKHLFPGEPLLAYTESYLVGLIRRKLVLVGLTPFRLILVMLKSQKNPDNGVSIRHHNISSMHWSRGLFEGMQIKIGSDALNFRFGSLLSPGRRKRINKAKEFTELADRWILGIQITEQVNKELAEREGRKQAFSQEQMPTLKRILPPEDEMLVQQAKDFTALGLIRPARQELNKALELQPSLSMEPDVIDLKERLLDDSAATKRVGLFFLIHAGLFILRVALLLLLGEAGNDSRYLSRFLIPMAGFEIYVGVNLYRGRSETRSWALYWAAALMFFTSLFFLTDDSMFGSERNLWDLILGASFSLSIILPLTGSKSQMRTTIATIAFAVGYFGPSLALLIAELV